MALPADRCSKTTMQTSPFAVTREPTKENRRRHSGRPSRDREGTERRGAGRAAGRESRRATQHSAANQRRPAALENPRQPLSSEVHRLIVTPQQTPLPRRRETAANGPSPLPSWSDRVPMTCRMVNWYPDVRLWGCSALKTNHALCSETTA